jgi:hypothetical protein
MDNPLDELGLSQRLTVRLDTMVIEPNRAEVGLRAVPLRGFRGRRAPAEPRLIWWIHHGTDTLEIGTVSLSGASWRLAPSGDSLVGETHLFFDVAGTDRLAGSARARRAACDA